MLKEFKEFAMRGNVLDMAVGVVIGGAFGKIVTSFLNDVMMPPLGLVTGGADFTEQRVVLKTAAGAAKAVAINYGAFITAVVDFAIVALAVFLLVKMINAMKREAPAAAAEPTEKQCPECLMNVPIKAKRCGHCAQPLGVTRDSRSGRHASIPL
ncbi:MAG: large-conductance mechanosensitive channel protein MscL [Elusimicrobia bacterium]|nr:large-conductance mechanosensitive channel protein MscL [Elusimicrobiota bacterium]